MTNKNLLRVGGISAFIGLAFTLADILFTGVTSPNAVPLASKLLNSAAALSLIPFAYALYTLYRGQGPTLSKIGLAEVVLAAALFILCMVFLNLQPLALYNFAFTAIYIVPGLIFGILAYQHPHPGMSRLLGVIGIASGLVGLVRFVILTLGGGDWTNLNNPALAPSIMVSYITWIVLGLIWWVWMGIALVRREA